MPLQYERAVLAGAAVCEKLRSTVPTRGRAYDVARHQQAPALARIHRRHPQLSWGQQSPGKRARRVHRDGASGPASRVRPQPKRTTGWVERGMKRSRRHPPHSVLPAAQAWPVGGRCQWGLSGSAVMGKRRSATEVAAVHARLKAEFVSNLSNPGMTLDAMPLSAILTTTSPGRGSCAARTAGTQCRRPAAVSSSTWPARKALDKSEAGRRICPTSLHLGFLLMGGCQCSDRIPSPGWGVRGH